MSNLYAIGVIGALFIAMFAVTVHVVHLLNRKNIEISTGAVGGVRSLGKCDGGCSRQCSYPCSHTPESCI